MRISVDLILRVKLAENERYGAGLKCFERFTMKSTFVFVNKK